MLKQIRLSQVHPALSSPEVQETIGGSTVHEIAYHYGFHSRNHFARDYRNQFGESPQRHASTGIRSGNKRPIGLRGPEPPDGHGPEVVTGPEGVHRSDRLRGAELQTTGIHLLNNR